MVETIICCNCIRRLGQEQNKQQSARRRKEARRIEVLQSQLKLPLAPVETPNIGTAEAHTEFLLRESVRQAKLKVKKGGDSK